MTHPARTALAFTLLLGLTAPVAAASFDCAKASAPDELAICANPRLSELDTLAGTAYDRLRRTGPDPDLQQVARDFLADRRRCVADQACIMASYVAIIGTYADRGSKVALPEWADAAGIAGNGPLPATIPLRIGRCAATTVGRVAPRLDPGHPVTSSDFDSGTGIDLTNRAHQVSYERDERLLASRPGDPVLLCLTSIPHRCPAGDDRGRTYATTNLRTHLSWWLPDSQHSCGGA